MLSQLRKGAASWVAKILIGLLILSFAVWGVEGLILNSTEYSLATVGDVEVSREDYAKLYPTVLGEWRKRLKKSLTRQQIRAFDIPSQVKHRLINQAVVDNHVGLLDLGVSDHEIGETIKHDPQLRDGAGQFNKELLKQVLRSERVSEQDYFNEQRTTALRTQITSIFTQKRAIPDILINSLYHHREDKLKVEYFVVPASASKKSTPPSDAELQDFYKVSTAAHQAPEYRKVALYTLSLDALKKATKASEEDIKKTFEARKKQYITPATRTYEQLVFESMEKALEAHKALNNGDKFEDVAVKFTASKKADKIGPVTEPSMADPKLAKIIFGLKKDEYSAPVEGTFAITIAKVVAARERSEKTLKDVRDEITKMIQERTARKEIKALYDKVEDLRSSGMTIDEVGKEMGSKATIIEAIDSRSAGPDGKPATNLPATKKLTASVFDADIGDDTVPVRHVDGGYVWFDILKITPKRTKSYDEVKATVLKQLIAKNKNKQASEFASGLVKKIEGGEDFAKVAASVKSKIKNPKDFGRGTSLDDIPVYFTNKLFAVKDNDITSGLSADKKSWLIVKVLDHVPAKESGRPYEVYRTKLITEMQAEMNNDLVQQYLDGAKLEFGVQENAQLFKTLKSGY